MLQIDLRKNNVHTNFKININEHYHPSYDDMDLIKIFVKNNVHSNLKININEFPKKNKFKFKIKNPQRHHCSSLLVVVTKAVESPTLP